MLASTRALRQCVRLWWTELPHWQRPRVLKYSAPAFSGRHSSSSRDGCCMFLRHWALLAGHLLKGEQLLHWEKQNSPGTHNQMCRHRSFSFVSGLDNTMPTISFESFTKTSIHSFSLPASIWAKSLGFYPASRMASAQLKDTCFPSMKSTGKSSNLTRLGCT